VVGYDSRFMGEHFAKETARVLAGSNVPVFICKRDTPTPVIAFEIMRRGTAGAINFTASHNPYNYNGIKFSTAWGGPALPEVTAEIERMANAMLGEVCYRDMPLDQACLAKSAIATCLLIKPSVLVWLRKLIPCQPTWRICAARSISRPSADRE